jgi:hypothetical protein
MNKIEKDELHEAFYAHTDSDRAELPDYDGESWSNFMAGWIAGKTFATHAAASAGAAGTIDTEEFRTLVGALLADERTALVTHIDQHTAAAVAEAEKQMGKDLIYYRELAHGYQKQWEETAEELAALRAATAPVSAADQFCDANCTWRDHAAGCERSEGTPVTEPFPGVTITRDAAGAPTIHNNSGYTVTVSGDFGAPVSAQAVAGDEEGEAAKLGVALYHTFKAQNSDGHLPDDSTWAQLKRSMLRLVGGLPSKHPVPPEELHDYRIEYPDLAHTAHWPQGKFWIKADAQELVRKWKARGCNFVRTQPVDDLLAAPATQPARDDLIAYYTKMLRELGYAGAIMPGNPAGGPELPTTYRLVVGWESARMEPDPAGEWVKRADWAMHQPQGDSLAVIEKLVNALEYIDVTCPDAAGKWNRAHALELGRNFVAAKQAGRE